MIVKTRAEASVVADDAVKLNDAVPSSAIAGLTAGTVGGVALLAAVVW